MESQYKTKLKSIVLELRHTLEGYYDNSGVWHPGDLEDRLATLGIRRDRESLPHEQLPHLSAEDLRARLIVDAFIKSAEQAGWLQKEAVGEFLQEAAYTWANRFIALRCMEARSLIDEIIIQKENYGGRSLKHYRLTRQTPGVCAGDDDGLYAALFAEFSERAEELPMLFHPDEPVIALKPGVAALKKCIRLLSDEDEIFTRSDALGWAYQYWNNEEKDRVFEKVRTVKGAKIEKSDIIPATQLYTEPYMVKFLVQNSLGALWMAMHPESRLSDTWEYYVRDADRATVPTKPLKLVSFLDPSVGSGHFLITAFDLFYSMYEEEGDLKAPSEICETILSHNLYGIDIDERAIQIAACALYMKAKEKAPSFRPTRINLTATNIHSNADMDHLAAFLDKHPEDRPFQTSLQLIFESLQHADQLGTLLQIEEPVEKEFLFRKALDDEEKAGPPKQEVLFSEMNKPEQAPLPMGVQSYEEWKAGLLERLRAHFKEEFVSADFSSCFFGDTAEKGLSLFDFLSRRYDVVATNPPYMGFRTMGNVLNKYVNSNYGIGKNDLYSSFILRCCELTRQRGSIAMVTRKSWLTITSFTKLRINLIRNYHLECVVDLGARAFDPENKLHDGVDVVLFIIRNKIPDNSDTFFLNTREGQSPTEKSKILCDKCNKELIKVPCSTFSRLPMAQILYSMPKTILDLLRESYSDGIDGIRTSQGITTGDKFRYSRYIWEIGRRSQQWPTYSVGGGYRKWAGFEYTLLDWRDNGARIKNRIHEKYPPEKYTLLLKHPQYYVRTHCVYTSTSAGALGVRVVNEVIASDSGPLLMKDGLSSYTLSAILNSRIATYIARILSGYALCLRDAYVSLIPIPELDNSETEKIATLCVNLKREYLSRRELIEPFFNSHSLTLKATKDSFTNIAISQNAIYSIINELEGFLESNIFQAYSLKEHEVAMVLSEMSQATASFPLINDYDAWPDLSKDFLNISFPAEFTEQYDNRERKLLSIDQISKLKNKIKILYESGQGSKESTQETDDAVDDDASDEDAVVVYNPIPVETFLEELSQKLEIHPISVYWLLKEGIEQEGWRCLPEEQRLTKDCFTVLILRLLGHLWPKQIEADEPIPDWADSDGIIPLKEGTEETILYQRLRERLAADYGNDQVSKQENIFEEVMNKTLNEWVGKDFFRHHISQFKKRPIAWHISSARWTNRPRQDAAFECLVYYHKTDGDILPKLKSQYVVPLLKRMETELRGLESANGSLTGEQETRKGLISDRIQELNTFDSILTDVSASGFGPIKIQPQIRQYAINDAMLCLKGRWLKRLSDLIEKDPLANWQTLADQTGLHPQLAVWITEAIIHLDYHCTVVGPHPPLEETLADDPTTQDLALMICAESQGMLMQAMRCACNVWWQTFDATVLKPIAEKIKDAKKEQQFLKEQLLDTKGDAKVQLDMKRKSDALKSDIKVWKQELEQKRSQGKGLRDEIESWPCPEAMTWEAWLAEQAMYDQLSSLNEKRQLPQTIAEFIRQESLYQPDINDGVRANIAPLQRAGLLTTDVLASKDLDKAIADRAVWRDDERRWCREGKLPKPGWWV